jgi:hypothetical protein
MPAVASVITAATLARCPQRNEPTQSSLPGSLGFPIVAVKSEIKGRLHRFASLIATHSQLEEIT